MSHFAIVKYVCFGVLVAYCGIAAYYILVGPAQ
jgi:hypothetical protein